MKNNVSYIYAPKGKDPFTGVWNNKYLVPAVDSSQGEDINYIIVTCCPSLNGVWVCKAENYKNYKTWDNNGRLCYYVPIDDCEYKMSLEDLKNPPIINAIKNQQQRWWRGQVKGKEAHKRGKPEWML